MHIGVNLYGSTIIRSRIREDKLFLRPRVKKKLLKLDFVPNNCDMSSKGYGLLEALSRTFAYLELS